MAEGLDAELQAMMADADDAGRTAVLGLCGRESISDVNGVIEHLKRSVPLYLKGYTEKDFEEHGPDAEWDALEEDRLAYVTLMKKPFEPESFKHRSLDVAIVTQLTFTYGSKDAFVAAVRAGTKLDEVRSYVAWLYGLVPVDAVFAYPVALRYGSWAAYMERERKNARG